MHFSYHRLLVFVLTISTLLLGACQKESRQSDEDHAKAVAIWQSHEAAVARAVSGIIINDEFEDACEFFGKLTGIAIRGNGSYVGWTPNEETREDLHRIREWYQKNGELLYWDSAEGEVEVRR